MVRIILCLVSLIALPALAADTTGPDLHAFTPPPGDISVDFLRRIFGSVVDGRGQDGEQSVLGAAMGVFNTAVLFLGMIFVGYTTVKGTLDSAHDGVLLGKQMSEIWVPIRTLIGTSFLLPLGSGFSFLQTLVLWLALQGVGVADLVWQAALDEFSERGTLGHISVPDARPLAANILRAEVCMAAMNKQFAESDRPERIVAGGVVAETDAGKVVEYRWQSTARKTSAAACGALSWTRNSQESRTGRAAAASSTGAGGELSALNVAPWLDLDSTSGLSDPLFMAHDSAVMALIGELRPVAAAIVATSRKPEAGIIEAAAGRYEAAVAAAAKAAVDRSPQIALQGFLKHARDGGWVLAGTWFSHAVKVNDSIQAAVNMVPVSKPIRIEDLEVQETLQNYRDAIALTDEFLLDRSGAVRRAYDVSIEDAKSLRSMDDAWRLMSVPAMAGLDALTTRIAGANTAPVEQLRVLGNEIIVAGTALKGAYALMAGFAGSRAADWSVGNVFNISEALRTVNGSIEWTSSALWALGAVLAFYLPAVPTIWWVAGVVRWLAGVAEAVLAAPLMAAMHIHPGGDDLVGRAGPGYMLILAMVIQPALLVFGLVLAGAIMYPAGALVNMMFLGMVSGITGSSGVGLIALVAWTGLYVGMMTMVIHAAFSLVNSVPDNVMRWVGATAGAPNVATKEVERTTGNYDQGARGAAQGAARPKAEGRGQGSSGGHGGNGITNADLLPHSDR